MADTPRKRAPRRKKGEGTTPLMAFQQEATAASSSLDSNTDYTRSRSNVSALIQRTFKYRNIEEGLIPFNYTGINYGKINAIDVRDAVILCQKAYYNFAQFRNVIDLMTEFSCGKLFFRGGTKKSREFFEALFNKINIDDFQDKFFREYYRSGNVFIYRFETALKPADIQKITQVYGEIKASKKGKVPTRYTLLNPADVALTGSLSFASPQYYKFLTNYELDRLKNPKTPEDQEIYESLDPEAKEKIRGGNSKNQPVLIPLDPTVVTAVFYKKQDYEPFAVPMGFPVLEDLNFKQELKKMDMAIGRCMQQAILLVTMGNDPDKGGINQKNLQAMQQLFANQSVGRVLISDYTTKAEFVVPKIADLMTPTKYEIFDRDINLGLNNILVGGEKFANQSSKVDVFLARLQSGRTTFINDFLIPEVKRISKNLGFKNFPTPFFQEINLSDNPLKDKLYIQLYQLGALTAEEVIDAIKTDRLPDAEDSKESQEKFVTYTDNGLYSPLIGGKGGDETITVKEEGKKKAKPVGTPKSAGRPEGTTGIPQNTKNVSPIGEGPQSKAEQKYNLEDLKRNMILSQELEGAVLAEIKKEKKLKRILKAHKETASKIADIIIANEEPKNWKTKISSYLKNPIDKNPDRTAAVIDIAMKHNLDFYLASLLHASITDDPNE